MSDGIMENEMCPVFTARTLDVVRAEADEVDAYEWVNWTSFRFSVLDGSREVSPWCVEQVRALPVDPLSAPTQPASALPPAAR